MRTIALKMAERTLLVVAIAGIAILAMACGAEQSTSIVDTVEPEEAASVWDGPLVITTSEIAAGSSQEAIVIRQKAFVQAIRTQDAEAYVALCNPTTPSFDVSEADFFFNTVYSQITDLSGFGHRNVEIRMYGEDSARSDSDIFTFDEPDGVSISYFWSRVDGEWYSDSKCTF
jgi:hypothetical protein